MTNKTYKPENNFIVKVYDPMCSVWVVVAQLAFMPDQYTAEMVSNQYCKYAYCGYTAIRVCHRNKTLNEYNYD